MKISFTKRISEFLGKYALLLGALLIWLMLSETGIIPAYMLPSPLSVGKAFFQDFGLLLNNSVTSLSESALGLGFSILTAFVLAIMMDRYESIYKLVYPTLVVTQTIPVIAIAPLLVLWMGYGIAPKVFLVFLVCFFPLVVGLFDGLKSCDKDHILLLRTMNATENQILIHLKLPMALSSMFTGLKVSVSYAVVGSVIAEWLGGKSGLGVYMTRVRKSYSFDKMFAVIILISIISLIAIKLVEILEKKIMPWKNLN